MLTRTKLRDLRNAKPTTTNKLALAIELAGVTQMQVAAAVGIAQSQVSEDANGKYSEISLTKARAYAEFFGCAIEDLFPARAEVA